MFATRPAPLFYPIFIIYFVLFLVSPVFSQTIPPPSSPAKNPLCWTEGLCKDAGGDFIKGQEPCDKSSWGLCYPKPGSLTTDLQVHLGGVEKIIDSAQYVRLIYNVGLGIATTLSIVMIMVAGFRWMTAGGNPNAIGKAKSMIGSAVIGLLLLIGAALILETVNPDITKLTLPRFPKIRAQALNPTSWCIDIYPPNSAPDTKIKFANAGNAYGSSKPNLKDPNSFGDKDFNNITKKAMEDLGCGEVFYDLRNVTFPCYARSCDDLATQIAGEKICIRHPVGGFECASGQLGGIISSPPERQAKNIKLVQICNNGLFNDGVPGELVSVQGGGQSYFFSRQNISGALQTIDFCGPKGANLKGFALYVEVNEDSGFDDWFMLKRSGNNCERITEKLSSVSESNLFKIAEFQPSQQALRCDIRITDAAFPVN